MSESASRVPEESGPIVLEGKALSMTYPGAASQALQSLDITLRAGKALGLLGPNVAGKTTTLSIISTRLPPTAGSLSIAGVDVLKERKKARALLGYAPQEIALYPELSARENLSFFGGMYGLAGRELKQRIDLCLDFTLLGDAADTWVNAFSGGMKRRLNLAVATLGDPVLLLLDEPTVGIDTRSRDIILGSLRELVARGVALIYTTHYLEEIERICDEVIILDHGRTVAMGQPVELRARRGCGDMDELFRQLTSGSGM